MSLQSRIDGLDKRELIFGKMLQMYNKFQVVGDKFYKEITFKQLFLFACMGVFRPEAPTIKELSDLMGCSHQNVKVIASKLSEKGFIVFKTDENDKRKQRLYFTDYYYEIAVPYSKREDEFIDKLFSGMNKEELMTFISVLDRMDRNLKKIHEEL